MTREGDEQVARERAENARRFEADLAEERRKEAAKIEVQLTAERRAAEIERRRQAR